MQIHAYLKALTRYLSHIGISECFIYKLFDTLIQFFFFLINITKLYKLILYL